MKTEIITQEQARRVPEVGEVYESVHGEVFMRIEDAIGKAFFNHPRHIATAIYGVLLTDGVIAAHHIPYTFTILQPVGGVAKFERV